jgi:zinc protease
MKITQAKKGAKTLALLSLPSLLAMISLGAGGLEASPKPLPKPATFTSTKIENGLEVVALPSPKVPLVTIVLVVKAGAMTETKDINGLTHLWEHMFFKGNARLPNQEAFNRRIRELGIVYNGDTSAETVRYYFTLPSVHLEAGLQFMADAISTPLIEQVELEKERRVVLDEYDRSASQPAFDMRNLQRRIIYGELDWRRDPLGARPTIETATREQLLRIRDEVFVPSNSALFVGGDVNPEALVPLVRKHFGAWKDPLGWKPLEQPKFPAFPKTQQYVMLRPLVENAQIEISFNGPKATEDVLDTYAADVLIHLLEHRAGKFYRKFEDSGLTFGAALSYPTQARAGEISLYAQSKPEKAVEVQAALLAEINEWVKPGYFSKEQFEDVRRRLEIDHKMQINKVSEYVKSLGYWWSVTGLEYYGNYIPNMRKVDVKDVQNFVRKWLIGKNHVATILVSPEGAKAAGLQDTSKEIADKLLADYRAVAAKTSGGSK